MAFKLWQNIPFVLIILPLLASAICMTLRHRAARRLMICVSAVSLALNVIFLVCIIRHGESYTFKMGEWGAPIGNELRCGILEGIVGTTFSGILFLSLLGGVVKLKTDVDVYRMNLYSVLTCLLSAAMMAETFTNDLFTAYVFIEIITIAAGALICINNHGRTLFAATRYMIMNLLGSGLFLLGLAMLYCLTGHLLFPQLREAVQMLSLNHRYTVPLALSMLLMALGIGIKSALYPFHTWLPNAYANATPSSSAMLSSLISKVYIFLLVKIVFRVSGIEFFASGGIGDVLFVFSCIGIILGSIDAILEHNCRRMIAYSSVAQIGYIFLGVSLGTQMGAAAAVFHICAHSAAKAMLFLSADRLVEVSGGSAAFRDLRGSGFRAPLAGVAFAVGALSIVGIPLLGGFTSKIYLCMAATGLDDWRMIVMLLVLAVSTLLNVAYLVRTVLTLYRNSDRFPSHRVDGENHPTFAISMAAFIALNIFLGVGGYHVMQLIQKGMLFYL